MFKVVVVGGGYGGLRAVEHLVKDSNIEIVLIDENPYHYLQTEAYGYIAGRFNINDLAVDLNSWCLGFGAKVKFIHAKVENFDYDKQEVYFKKESLSYDYLIIAVGAKTNFFSFIQGLKENAYGVKSLQETYSFRQKFESLIYQKLLHHKEKEELNIVIAGAGLSGVEVAAEMAYVLQLYSKTIGSRTQDIKIYLVDASETILPGLSAYLIKNTQQRLSELEVNILTNSFITKVDHQNLYFKDNNSLSYNFMIFTGGIRGVELMESISDEKNSLNQLIADERLNIQGHKNVYAIGDCVQLQDKNSTILAPTAQTAEKSAEYVVKCIQKSIRGQVCTAFDEKISGVFIALGGNYGVGEMFGFIKVKGYGAFLLKKAITYAYLLGLHLRINIDFKNRIKKE